MGLLQPEVAGATLVTALGQPLDKLLLALYRQRGVRIEQCRHLRRNDAIGIAERNIFRRDEFVGTVGREELKTAGGYQALSIDFERTDDQGAYLQALLREVERLHKWALRLLVVHVIAGGQPVDDAQDLL